MSRRSTGAAISAVSPRGMPRKSIHATVGTVIVKVTTLSRALTDAGVPGAVPVLLAGGARYEVQLKQPNEPQLRVHLN